MFFTVFIVELCMLYPKVINIFVGILCSTFLFSADAFSFSWSQIELHHIFPQAYAGWFKQRDIDPDMWCIPLSREQHTGSATSIHHKKYTISGGKDFNNSWKLFIEKKQYATQGQCFTFATLLLAEFGINLKKATFYNYKTKKISDVKIPKNKAINNSLKFAAKYIKFGNRFIKLSPYILIAYELYEFASKFNIKIDEDDFDRAMEAYMEGEKLYHEKKYRESLNSMLISNYLFGKLFYDCIIERTRNLYAYLASKFNTEKQKKAMQLCLVFFINANELKEKLNINFPQIPLYLGEVYAILGNRHDAKKYLTIALHEFEQRNNSDIANEIRRLINELT